MKVLNFHYFLKLLLLLICLCGSSTSYAADESVSSALVYVKPDPIKRASPVYPKRRLSLLQAGMVEVEFMVDKNGVVFEPIVTDSSHPEFESAAIRAVRKYLYAPATLNGQSVESRSNIRILFYVEDAEEAVGSKFAAKYRKVRKMLVKETISEKDRKVLRRKLNAMADSYGLSRYGLVHLSYAESLYAKRFSSKEALLDAYKNVLLYTNREGESDQFLDNELEKSARIVVTQLEAQLGRYGHAIDSYKEIKKEFPTVAQELTPLMTKINQIVSSDDPFATQLSLGSKGYQLARLLKRNFALLDVSGEIRELKIRCDRKFAQLKYQPESEYAVPESWGACYLEVLGESNVTANLVQF